MALLLTGDFIAGWELFEHRPGGRYCRRNARPWPLWNGDPMYAADRSRSIPLEVFRPLAELPGISLFSLQKGFGAEQLANISWGQHVHDIAPMLDGSEGAFLDSAAILKLLDLLVTSDSALAHVAGALGVPVWVLLPKVPDWRWRMEGENTPWYPTARLFRQARLGDWKSVIAEVVKFIQDHQRSRTPTTSS
jgi:Glycosyltransferase family 9 (heptosyltransferase)